MGAGVVVAGAVLALPPLFTKPSQPADVVVLIQVVLGGVIVGLGRQGIDVLLIRLLATAALMLAALSAFHDVSISQCVGVGQCGWISVLIVIGIGFLAAVLGIFAVPTAALWNHGFAALRPEGMWRILRPRTPLHGVLLVVCVVGFLIVLDLFLGIPSY